MGRDKLDLPAVGIFWGSGAPKSTVLVRGGKCGRQQLTQLGHSACLARRSLSSMSATGPTPEELRNLTPETLRYLLDQDFRAAWDALAKSPDIHARGNFMFGREAVGLLELASRVCSADSTGEALKDLSAELERIDPRYFTPLPAPAEGTGGFKLPSSPSKGSRENQLISIIFDLVRHGQAHQRQQIMVETTDAKTFGISLTGAGYGRTLADRTSAGRPTEHLSVLVDEEDNVYLVVCPEILFLDLQDAINASGIFQRGLDFDYLERPRPGKSSYAYTAADVHQALLAGGHQAFQPAAPAATQKAAAAEIDEGAQDAAARSRSGGRYFVGGLAAGLLTAGLIAGLVKQRRARR